MHPELSIIMPVYNAENFLSKAIDSVLKQTMQEFELILIDDGSKDNSSRICDDYAMTDKRIVVIHQPNGGICQARNTGIKMARGKYIGFMDHDDEIVSTAFEENYKLLLSNKADWVKFGKTEIVEMAGRIIKVINSNYDKRCYSHTELMDNLLKLRAAGTMTFIWDSFMKKNIVASFGLMFDENYVSGNEDIDFCEEYARHCNNLVVNDKCYYIHYTRMGISASTKYSKEKVNSYVYLLKKSNARYEEYGLCFSQDIDYQYVVSKQILANICQRLNDAGAELNRSEKKNELKRIKGEKAMEAYNKMDASNLKSRSLKLYLFFKLYQKDYFDLLLWIDKYSRKVIYGFKARKRSKGLIYHSNVE